MAHMDYGRRLLDQMVKDLSEIAVVEQAPSMEGRTLGLLLSPSRKAKVARPDGQEAPMPSAPEPFHPTFAPQPVAALPAVP
jgi:translation initiation factor IF-3